MTLDKDTESKNGWTKQCTKVSGLTIKQKVKEYFGMQKVISILVTLKMTRLMEMGFINISMAVDMKDSG